IQSRSPLSRAGRRAGAARCVFGRMGGGVRRNGSSLGSSPAAALSPPGAPSDAPAGDDEFVAVSCGCGAAAAGPALGAQGGGAVAGGAADGLSPFEVPESGAPTGGGPGGPGGPAAALPVPEPSRAPPEANSVPPAAPDGGEAAAFRDGV